MTPLPARSTEESGPRSAKLFVWDSGIHSSSLPSTSRLARCRVDWAGDLTAITAAGHVFTPIASYLLLRGFAYHHSLIPPTEASPTVVFNVPVFSRQPVGLVFSYGLPNGVSIM